MTNARDSRSVRTIDAPVGTWARAARGVRWIIITFGLGLQITLRESLLSCSPNRTRIAAKAGTEVGEAVGVKAVGTHKRGRGSRRAASPIISHVRHLLLVARAIGKFLCDEAMSLVEIPRVGVRLKGVEAKLTLFGLASRTKELPTPWR